MSTPQPAAEWVRIGDLLPWERNPKHHPTENVAEIARSVIRRRWTRWAKEHGKPVGSGGLE